MSPFIQISDNISAKHFQYQALPFGLLSAPRVFTKLMAALAGYLKTLPIRVQFYLDDILIQSRSKALARKDLATTMQVLQDHGFSINHAKSHLEPSTRLLHLGAVIDTVGFFFPRTDRLV